MKNVLWFFFSFKGRISRLPFWCAGIIFLPAYFMSDRYPDSYWVILLDLLLLWCGIATSVKRWHDRNKSAWWVFINLIPIINLWGLVECGFLHGTDGPNKYGEDPIESE